MGLVRDIEGVVIGHWRYGGWLLMIDSQDVGGDWTICKCKMHKPSQVGVSGDQGCNTIPVGKHPVVRTASLGENHVCAVEPGVRKKDARFYALCARKKWHRKLAYEDDSAYARECKDYATGANNMMDFGKGYCHLLALREGYENRVARVFGPNMYAMDYLKVLCVASKRFMEPLEVVDMGNGFLHVQKKEGLHLPDGGAGKRFYEELVMRVKENNFARIGGQEQNKIEYIANTSLMRSMEHSQDNIETKNGLDLEDLEIMEEKETVMEVGGTPSVSDDNIQGARVDIKENLHVSGGGIQRVVHADVQFGSLVTGPKVAWSNALQQDILDTVETVLGKEVKMLLERKLCILSAFGFGRIKEVKEEGLPLVEPWVSGTLNDRFDFPMDVGGFAPGYGGNWADDMIEFENNGW